MAGSSTPTGTNSFATIEEAIEDFRAGKMVVIVDSPDRENEGDVCVPAELCTADHVNFMATWARGLVCLTMAPDKVDRLGLSLMAPPTGSIHDTSFTVTIEAAEGVTTGISAADRAHTMRLAASADATPGDFVSPGHVFPLRARPGGVLERTGQTEGSVDLARLAGLEAAAVICEVMNDDGTMARVDDLEVFCERHGLKMICIDDLIAYRRRTERQIERTAAAALPTRHGDFHAVGYQSLIDGMQHLAMVRGEVEGREDVLVRIHAECCTGDVFGSLKCECRNQLEQALATIDAAGEGVLLYVTQEGRGITRMLQQGRNAAATEVDVREYDLIAQVLQDLGLRSVRLITDDAATAEALARHGVEVAGHVALAAPAGAVQLPV